MTYKNLNLYLLFFIIITNCCAQKANNKLDKKLISTASNFINTLGENNEFSGTILIAKKDSILFELASGEASKRYRVKNNINTKFNLGSNNKMFTGIAIMQLYERNLLDLDDKISRYIDSSWLPKSITDKVSIHHLLSHTSGFGDFFNSTYEKSAKEYFRNIEDFKPLIKGDTLAFEPGSQVLYSNMGMLLLGVIIENLTGKSYFDYVSDNIYDPLKMDNTACYEMDKPIENLAIGYYKSDGQWRNNLFKHVIKGGPSGGGFSTVRDLHKFGQGILDNKLISDSSKEILFKIQTKLDGPAYKNYGYGYGFVVIEDKQNKVIGHLGGFTGISSGFFTSLNDGYIICVLSNYDAVATQIAVELSKVLLDNN